MAELTKSDIELIQEKARQIKYGFIELEFKDGKCTVITDHGRTYTEFGRSRKDGQKQS